VVFARPVAGCARSRWRALPAGCDQATRPRQCRRIVYYANHSTPRIIMSSRTKVVKSRELRTENQRTKEQANKGTRIENREPRTENREPIFLFPYSPTPIPLLPTIRLATCDHRKLPCYNVLNSGLEHRSRIDSICAHSLRIIRVDARQVANTPRLSQRLDERASAF
jgi:hypothetical protein